MSEGCKKRGCSRKKYEEYERCVLHCDKPDFTNPDDLRRFWQVFREEYIVANYYEYIEDIEVSDVVFPSFDNNAFIHITGLNKNCTFNNCIFEYDFNLAGNYNRSLIVFNNCTFFGDIKLYESSEINIIDSEFKKELYIGNNRWQKLNISNTKFIKDVRISVNEQLDISDESIFRGNFHLDGSEDLKFNFENSQCSKKFSVENTQEINVDNIEIKSDTDFVNSNASINIKNNSFTSNVRVGGFTDLVLNSVSFTKELKIDAENYHKMVFNDVNLIDWELDSGNHLELIKTKFSGSFLQKGQFQTIKIKDSKIDKDFELSNVNNLNLEKLVVNGITNLNGEYDEININQESRLKNTTISTSEKLNINDVTIEGNLDLLGDSYEDVSIEKTNITNEININDVSELKLKNIKSKPTVKLLSNQYENVLVDDVRFDDFEIQMVNNLDINDSIIWGKLSFEDQKSGSVKLSGVKLKNKCGFPELDNLNLLEESHFDKQVYFEKATKLIVSDSIFKDVVCFTTANYGQVLLGKCEFHKEVFAQERCVFDNFSTTESKYFYQFEFKGTNFKLLQIIGTEFKDTLELTNSDIGQVNIGHKNTEQESYKQTIFWSIVDFSFSKINNIKIVESKFTNKLIFNNMKNQLNLNSISDVSIDSLNIKNTKVVNIFRDSEAIFIANLNIEKSKLDSNYDEINIDKVNIENLKWNNLEITKNLNMTSVEIKKLTVGNLNMEHRLKIKHSSIESMSFIASTFEDLQIIDNTKDSYESRLSFKNTTIKSAVLDKLMYESFIMSDAHVSEAKIGYVKFEKGSRETNRFFKNYYDSISDYIQANEYYKQEMQEQYKVTSNEGEKFILGFNKAISDFGQSWLRPLAYILATTVLFLLMIHKDKITFDAKFVVYFVCNFNDIWNGFWKFINPFSKTASNTYSDVYGWWMIHKLLMTIFIYHFIVAIKRKTRR